MHDRRADRQEPSCPFNPHFPDEFGFSCTRRPNLR
jgi:hypothetical protein